MRFLSLQSHVAYGYVGNRAATFPLQRLGHEVWAVNTVEFSNHTGYGAWRGRTAPAGQVAEIVQGIEALGLLPRCDALLTGYVGDAALADVVLDTARGCAPPTPRPSGAAIRCWAIAIPASMSKPASTSSSVTAPCPRPTSSRPIISSWSISRPQGRDPRRGAGCRAPLLNGPRLALITSLRRTDAPADQIEMLAVTKDAAWRIATPLIGFPIAPNGTGDAVAALFSAMARERRRCPGTRQGRFLDLRRARAQARWANANCNWWRRRISWLRRPSLHGEKL